MKKLRKYGRIIILPILLLTATIAPGRILPPPQERGEGNNIAQISKSVEAQISQVKSESYENSEPVRENNSKPTYEMNNGLESEIDDINLRDPYNIISVDLPGFGFPVLLPDIEDEKIYQTMIDSISESLLPISDSSITRSDDYFAEGKFFSDRFFSSRLTFYFKADDAGPPYKDSYYVYIHHTIDLETGKILYLDDIVDVAELEKLVLTSGYARIPEWNLDKGDGSIAQDKLDRFSESIIKKLAECSQPYKSVLFKPYFYLEGDRLFLMDVFAFIDARGRHHVEVYIKLDDILHILKINV